MSPNVLHVLGQPCASERSSWTFSHLFMIEVTADPHMYREGHLVPCCPLHERPAGVVDFSTVHRSTQEIGRRERGNGHNENKRTYDVI